jgi:hypothetical protein
MKRKAWLSVVRRCGVARCYTATRVTPTPAAKSVVRLMLCYVAYARRGLLYCMEYLEENLDEWLGEELQVPFVKPPSPPPVLPQIVALDAVSQLASACLHCLWPPPAGAACIVYV